MLVKCDFCQQWKNSPEEEIVITNQQTGKSVCRSCLSKFKALLPRMREGEVIQVNTLEPGVPNE